MPTGHKLTPDMLAAVRRQACRKLKNIGKAHGFDHALRVETMALDFISDSPETDLMLVSLFALLPWNSSWMMSSSGLFGFLSATAWI